MPGDHSSETRNRILGAAQKVFSDSGYNGASIREIITRAGTNLSSVNYHFGGKEALYREVVEAAFSEFSNGPGWGIDDLDLTDTSSAYIHAFAKQRLLAGIRSDRHFPPRLIGWEIVARKFDIKGLIEKRMSASEGNLIVLLSPLFDPSATAAQKSLAARWFLIATMPPAPIAFGLRKLLESDPGQATIDQTLSQLADAAVAGVRCLTSAPGCDVHADADVSTDGASTLALK